MINLTINKTKNLIITPISNIDFDETEIIDHSLIEEKVFLYEDTLNVYRKKKEEIYARDILEEDLFIFNGNLYKILNIL